MSGFLFDTNVLLDIATADPVWLPWSEHQFRIPQFRGQSSDLSKNRNLTGENPQV